MTIHHEPRSKNETRAPAQHAPRATETVSEPAVTTPVARKALAVLRMVTGFVFLWAFLDKTFGLGYATPSGKGWIDGGSPTMGFLSHVSTGPLQSTFHDWAGAAWADWLFMLGLLGIGVALISGVALRLTAVAGTMLMAFMWMAEWPPAQHLTGGAPSMSTNPIVDYHVVYALIMIVMAAAYAGNTWGLGRIWARLPIVSRNRWLI